MDVDMAPSEGPSGGTWNDQPPLPQREEEKTTLAISLPTASNEATGNGVVSSSSSSSSSSPSRNDDSSSLQSSPSSSSVEAPHHSNLLSTNLAVEKYPHDDNPANSNVDASVEAEDNVRRSGREKVSTLVYIDGQPVLAKNNYQVNADSYIFDKEGSTTSKPATKNVSSIRKTVVKPPAVPRVLTESERLRLENNQAIQARKDAKQADRKAFLASKLNVMEPFLDEKVKEELRNVIIPEETSGRVDQNVLYMQPEGITADLRDYQLDSLNWMVGMHKKNIGMILGDEMGLGKTLQTISLLVHLKEQENTKGPSLVICPLSVLYSWCSELSKWAPSLKILRLHSSSPEEREAQRLNFSKNSLEYDVVVTTYEMAKAPNMRSLWSRQYFHYLVLDEGHRVKDAHSQISKAVRLIHCENRLLLTGTPLQNNLVELWSLLYFLLPDIFLTSEPFAQAFELNPTTGNRIDKHRLLETNKFLSVFMLRRLKNQVEKLMPKKVETRVLCPLSNTQVFWYKSLLMKDINLLARVTTDGGDDADHNPTPNAATNKVLSNLVMQLRKCCLHPYLFDGAEVDIEATKLRDLIAASGKLAVLDKLLRSLHRKKHRVVLFSQFTSVLDILDDYCSMRGWKHCRFDGSTPRARRNYTVNQFNAPDSELFIFLMSTRSGGMGLNLQTADTCILFDSDWNPQPDLQAMARVHRIGQKNTVHVYRLVCGGSIEERMVERAQKKLYLDQMVNQDTAKTAAVVDTEEDIDISKGELLASLKFGCDAVFGAGNEKQNMLPTDEEIEVITDRNRSETFSDGKLKGGAVTKASEFKADEEFSSTTNLGGIDFKKIREETKKQRRATGNAPAKDLGEIVDAWRKHQKRNRKNRIVNIEVEGGLVVPVLSQNNYDLESGESSVFQRELGGRKVNCGEVKRKVLRSGVDFGNQDTCQVCGLGGLLMCCPLCPVCVHQECVGASDPKCFLSCPHHRCCKCGKSVQTAGGMLFPCQSCPQSFCEDCLPVSNAGFQHIDTCPRFENLGYVAKNFSYIHCSELCEQYARTNFDWSEPKNTGATTPEAIDLSLDFGSEIDSNVDLAESEVVKTRFRERKTQKYTEETVIIGDITTEKKKPKKKRSGQKPAPTRAPGTEYNVTLTSGRHGLLARFSGNPTKFTGYKKTPYKSKGPNELANEICIGDSLLLINGNSIHGKTSSEVKAILKETDRRTTHLRLKTKYPPPPPIPKRPSLPTAQPAKNAKRVKQAVVNDSPEYTAIIPFTPQGLLIKIAPVKSRTLVVGYVRYPDGSKGPAEAMGSIRNVGDAIVGINGIRTVDKPFHQVISLLSEAKATGVVALRLFDSKFKPVQKPSAAPVIPVASVGAPASTPFNLYASQQTPNMNGLNSCREATPATHGPAAWPMVRPHFQNHTVPRQPFMSWPAPQAAFNPLQSFPQNSQANGAMLPGSLSTPMQTAGGWPMQNSQSCLLPSAGQSTVPQQYNGSNSHLIGRQRVGHPDNSTLPGRIEHKTTGSSPTACPDAPDNFAGKHQPNSSTLMSQGGVDMTQTNGAMLPVSFCAPMQNSGGRPMQNGLAALFPPAGQSAMPQQYVSSVPNGIGGIDSRLLGRREVSHSDSTSMGRVGNSTSYPAPTVSPDAPDPLSDKHQPNSSNLMPKDGVVPPSHAAPEEIPVPPPRESTDAELRRNKLAILTMPVLKLCKSTGKVLETFFTADEARKSVSDSKQWKPFVKVLLAEGHHCIGPHYFKGYNWKLKGYTYTIANGGSIKLEKELTEDAAEGDAQPQAETTKEPGIPDAVMVKQSKSNNSEEPGYGRPPKFPVSDNTNVIMGTPDRSEDHAPANAFQAIAADAPQSPPFSSVSSVPSIHSCSSAERLYSVSVVKTTNGFLIDVAIENGLALFCGYRRTPDGRKGPTEAAGLFRHLEDRIVAVDGFSIRNGVTEQSFLELMTRAGMKGFVKFDVVECDDAMY